MELKPQHEKFMRRCLYLAAKGLGSTKSNPLVGAVIVYEDRIIGEGYHQIFGGHHAEVNAIQSVREKSLLKKSTLYVNLEPCSHTGKTPPCSLLIKESGIPKVIIAQSDPNPLVAGRGIKMLDDAGIHVTAGILEEEAAYLNRRFLYSLKTGMPYVILKWAASKDGFLDKIRNPNDPFMPNWITNHTARMLVHKWRSEEMAILAGVNTVLTDNPRLDVRDWPGKNPLRIVIDRNSRISNKYNVFDDATESLIFGSKLKGTFYKTSFIPIEKNANLKHVLKQLYERGVISLLVEGGSDLLKSFIAEKLWNEARVFTGDIQFEDGVKAPLVAGILSGEMIFRRHSLCCIEREK
jgi:diaminohydroxyphosphoribosylaminopyrimidine deaminase/5-amino-6-(5-phosphoribosylamino)uracil reductase